MVEVTNTDAALLLELEAIRRGEVPDGTRLHDWRARLLKVGAAAAVQARLADIWRHAPPHVRNQALQPLLEGVAIGAELTAVLLDTVEGGDPASGNAALRVLGDGVVTLVAQSWRRIARVAQRERRMLLPDREAAILLANHGPRSALATVVLTACRPGPEDADDRLQALAALGRFEDARVPVLVARLLAAGTGTLEGLQAAAVALARGEDPEPWLTVLHSALDLSDTDAWARWSALDGLSRLQPAQAVPLLVAAWRAAGEDLPGWYVPFCAQRAQALQSGLDPATWPGRVPAMAPLPGLGGRVQSRCPRIARAAMVEWQARHGADDPLIAQRAGTEKALVARGQLLGSFLVGPDTVAGPLGPSWAPSAMRLGHAERVAWEAEESEWLRAEDP